MNCIRSLVLALAVATLVFGLLVVPANSAFDHAHHHHQPSMSYRPVYMGRASSSHVARLKCVRPLRCQSQQLTTTESPNHARAVVICCTAFCACRASSWSNGPRPPLVHNSPGILSRIVWIAIIELYIYLIYLHTFIYYHYHECDQQLCLIKFFTMHNANFDYYTFFFV